VFQIGASLREARERRGLSSADVQKAIRIRDRYLTALEEERWELLPGDAYVKGFLRTYADFLGLDGSLYVEEYNSRFAHHDDQVLVPPAFGRSGGGLGVGLVRPLVALGAIAALVAAIAAWQLHGGGGSQQAGNRTTTQHQAATASHHRHRHPHAATQAALPTRAVLTAARGAVWLQVRSGGASGRLIYQNTLQQGQTLPVKLTSGPVWIRIGNPPGLDIRLGGKLLAGLPTQPGNVLLTRRGLQPA
jgi:hypothetical protein